MQVQLIVKKGSRNGEILVPSQFPITLGRGEQCAYQFEDNGVSRTHCLIDCVDNHLILQDLGSTNGTTVNGVKIQEPIKLQKNDVVVLGKVVAIRVFIGTTCEIPSRKEEGPKPAEIQILSEVTPRKHLTPTIKLPTQKRPRAFSTRRLAGEEEQAPAEPVKSRSIQTGKEGYPADAFDTPGTGLPAISPSDGSDTPDAGLLAIPGNDPLRSEKDFFSDMPGSKEEEVEGLIKRRINVEETSILMPREHLQHSYRALKTIYEVLQICNHETDNERMLESLLKSLLKAIVADRGAVVLKRQKSQQYDLKVFIGKEGKQGSRLPISRTILEEVIEGGLSLILGDANQDAKYRASESLRIQKVQSMICSPLVSRQQVFGAVYLDRTGSHGDPFRAEDLELLSAIGIQAGATLEKALLLEEVIRTNSYLESVIESVPVGIYTLNLKGLFTSWSEYSRQIFGYRAEEILEHADLSLLLADHETLEGIYLAVEKNGIFFDEIQMVRKDKTLFPCRFGISSIQDPSGNLLGYTGYHQDISEERKFREQMFAQEKLAALGMLAAGVAHDFNNILSLIHGYASLSLETCKCEIGKYLEKIITHTRRAGDVAGHLLQYSRQETKQYSESNLLSLLKEVLSLVEKELYASEITVFTEFQELPSQSLIPGQIQEVFLNIILNARDAMPQGGTLTLKTFAGEDGNRIIFEDTGEGIRPENIKRIFEPFFSTKEKTNKAGTGLGLAISYQIVKKHGGEILVQSAPGEGTSFELIFPLLQNGS